MKRGALARGSEVANTRATNLAVMKLLWKWRSGPELLRVSFVRLSSRGETPPSFSDNERVAAQGYEWFPAFVPIHRAFAMRLCATGSPSRACEQGGLAMAVKYDPNIIREHAATLYSRASRIVFMTGFLGFIAGGIVGLFLGNSMRGNSAFFGLVGALLGALVGVSIGRGRAFALQLQAQMALCQVAIEGNTRRAADAAVTAASPSNPEHVAPVS